MRSNFIFLESDATFASFREAAVEAERCLRKFPSESVLRCAASAEEAVRWVYAAEPSLQEPYRDALPALVAEDSFRNLVGEACIQRLNFILRLSQIAERSPRRIKVDQALLCLEHLHRFLDYIAFCYGCGSSAANFDASLVSQPEVYEEAGIELVREISAPEPMQPLMLAAYRELLAGQQSLLSERAAKRRRNYIASPLNLSEFSTRKIYIDAMLTDIGWMEGKDWLNEVELVGMPNGAGVGYADYVLYDDAHKPLAVIEAKKSSVDPAVGRQQAKLYADLLEKQCGRRPVIFLTNGFDTRIIDGQYPERRCATVYSKRDLEQLFNLRTLRSPLKHVIVNQDIAGRYYQVAAIKSVCEAFARNRRKALLVMATGSGKTRTVMALCEILLKFGWVKNILFLADRTALVKQAHKSFNKLLPNLTTTNLCEEKNNLSAHCVFSTYQTMIHCIDAICDRQGKIFTCGHFDLLICDEAHRSIYNKYQDIFDYFDSPLVGLTATPKDEIDKNTYEVFELEKGVPTYAYDLATAVKDGYLVDFSTFETHLKFVDEGIAYDDLTEEEREAYEETFAEDGQMPDHIQAEKINSQVFNTDTIRKVLAMLMEHGQRVDHGATLGKSIIFAKSHLHAEKILKVFNKEYPDYVDWAKVIDNQTKYSETLIDEFSNPASRPQIAISVDMLDTGIDIPEILNLVFFKPVKSKAKFWQMIGRGTRLCPELMDGKDKDHFLIFDICNNFAFFRVEAGSEVPNALSVQGLIFLLKANMARALQDLKYQTEYLVGFRRDLVAYLSERVQRLPRGNFSVQLHLEAVETFSDPKRYDDISYEDTQTMRTEIVPLLIPDDDEPKALGFDALVYGMELALLTEKPIMKAAVNVKRKASALAAKANIPAVAAQKEMLHTLLNTVWTEHPSIEFFEKIRLALRDLMIYIDRKTHLYDTSFEDTVLSVEETQHVLGSDAEGDRFDNLKSYREKVEFYIHRHLHDVPAFAKLKGNQPLTYEDIDALEKVLWEKLGTRDDYRETAGEKPLGEFVRELVGLDADAAKAAFAEFLNDNALDSSQIYFVNKIVEYIVHNGLLKDRRVFMEAPFSDNGMVTAIFPDGTLLQRILAVVESINENASVGIGA